jgi:lipopolysaccharide transport system permease protein
LRLWFNAARSLVARKHETEKTRQKRSRFASGGPGRIAGMLEYAASGPCRLMEGRGEGRGGWRLAVFGAVGRLASVTAGTSAAVLDYIVSIWKCRNFWLCLVANDLHLRYRRSVLGVGWSLLHPLATTLVLGTVFHEIFHQPIREYLPYLLCGLACWGYITGVVSGGCQTYIQAESYIRQHPLPLAVYPLRTTLGVMIHFLIALTLVIILSLGLRTWDRAPDPLSLLMAVPVLIAFGWAMGILAGYINVAFRDTQHVMDVVFQILFYITPIIYPANSLKGTRFGWLLAYNPLVPLIDLVREPLIAGHPASWDSWSSAILTTLTVGFFAALSLSYQQRRVVLFL